MKKLAVRITIVLTTIYFITCFFVAQFFGIDIFSDVYVLLFEFCVCLYCQDDKHYHCKYIRRLCWLIFMIDIFTRVDNLLDLVPITIHNLISMFLIILFTIAFMIQSFVHYIKVRKLKRKRYGKSNQKNCKDDVTQHHKIN